MNLCVNCKHVSIIDGFTKLATCHKSSWSNISPVDGSTYIMGIQVCEDERSEKGQCGPEGKFFAAKEIPTKPKWFGIYRGI